MNLARNSFYIGDTGDAELIRLTSTVLLTSVAVSLLLYSAATVGLAGIALVTLALLLAATGGAAIQYLRLHWKLLRLPRWLIDRRVERSARESAVAAGGEAGGAGELAIVMIAATISPLSPLDPVAQRQALLQAFLAAQRSTGRSDLLVVSASLQQTNERRRDG